VKDTTTTIQVFKDKVANFVKEREWNQFHSPKNLSMAIATEAAELMELFLWDTTEESYEMSPEKRQEIEDELADVIIAALAFTNATNIDLAKAIERKMKKTAEKYPVDKVKGKSHKYTYYQNKKK
jgi:dCTP diphosphatase